MKGEYKFLIEGQPLPRPNPKVLRSGIVFYPKKYNQYCQSLKDHIGWQFFNNEGTQLKGEVNLEIIFHRKGKRKADWENLGKPISDALQAVGVVKNDNQFTHIRIGILYGAKKPRTEIRVYN